MPATQGFADMIGQLAATEMGKPAVRAKRIEEAMIAHLIDNGHEIRVQVGSLIQATSKRRGYTLAVYVDEDAAELVFSVLDKNGKPVLSDQARTSPGRPHADAPPET